MNDNSMKDELSQVTVHFDWWGLPPTLLSGTGKRFAPHALTTGDLYSAAFRDRIEKLRVTPPQTRLACLYAHLSPDTIVETDEGSDSALTGLRRGDAPFWLEPIGGRSYWLHHPDGRATRLTFTDNGIEVVYSDELG